MVLFRPYRFNYLFFPHFSFFLFFFLLIYSSTFIFISIGLSGKFLSFYEEIIEARRFSFHIILSSYVRSILFCWDKHRDISQTWFHLCTKVHCCRKYVCERKTLFGEPNMSGRQNVSNWYLRVLITFVLNYHMGNSHLYSIIYSCSISYYILEQKLYQSW